MNENKEFRFMPRNEAHPMKWDALMTPVRKALADLLIRIDGAERAVNEVKDDTDQKEVANCFLLYGIRGTGKTTVLLSAQHALCPSSNFISLKEEGNPKEEPTPEENAVKKSINYLKEQHIVWLPILDLEPLPANTNLLTIILTHVLNSLESSDCGRKASPSSIFDESADSPRLKLKDLIRDATTTWEEIQEADTRTKANRQVAAVEMYANFQKRFQEVMTALSEQLGRKYGRDTKGCSVVLSIDNIDRCSDHIYAIAKYAELISHNRLWLIMAGEEKDIMAFLERGYWRELNYKKGCGILPSRENWEGEDETLVMARRQAASAYQKLLPPSHRIEIDRVLPDETLIFKPSGMDQNISELFNIIKIPLNELEEDKSKDILFFDLLAARKLINSLKDKKSNQYLTHLAKHALHLPARTVLDLWHLAHYVVEDNINTKGEKFKAERIARKMLRNAIYRSPISSELGKYLQDGIIRRSSEGGTVLNFDRHKVRVKYLLKQNLEKIPNIQQQPKLDSTSRSTLCMMKREDILIYFKNIGDIKEDTKISFTTELPDIVAAWLAILYDILMLVKRPAIINSINIESRLIMASHETATIKGYDKGEPKEFWWPAPLWKTFYAHDVFDKWWDEYYTYLLKFNFLHFCPKNDQEVVDLNTRLIVASWIGCVLEVFVALNDSLIEDSKLKKNVDDLRKVFTSIKSLKTSSFDKFKKLPKSEDDSELKNNAKEILKNLEEYVIKAVHDLYDAINYQDKNPVLIEKNQIKEWLEKKLPLLFSYLYTPLGKTEKDAVSRCNDMILKRQEPEAHESDLTLYWKKNASFFLADLDKELNEVFPRDKILKILHKNANLSHDYAYAYNDYLNSLGSFGALHQFWKREDFSDNEG